MVALVEMAEQAARGATEVAAPMATPGSLWQRRREWGWRLGAGIATAGSNAGNAAGGAVYVTMGPVSFNGDTFHNNEAQGGLGGQGGNGAREGMVALVVRQATRRPAAPLNCRRVPGGNGASGGDGQSAGQGGAAAGGGVYALSGNADLAADTFSANLAIGGTGGTGGAGGAGGAGGTSGLGGDPATGGKGANGGLGGTRRRRR